MGNCTGCEDQQTMEQRNEIFFDKSKKRCNENLKIMRSSKKLDKENIENKENKENKEPTVHKTDGKPPLKPTLLAEKPSNPINEQEKNQNKYPQSHLNPKENSEEKPMYQLENNEEFNEEMDQHIPKHLQKLENLPNYLNEHTQAVLEKLGTFLKKRHKKFFH